MRIVKANHNLETVNPSLAKEWHLIKNGSLSPKDVMPNFSKKVWWLCQKGHEWKATVNNRNRGSGCPFCSNNNVNQDNCLQNTHPTLAEEWHPIKNMALAPQDITAGSNKKVWWKCKKGHEWQAIVNNRRKGSGCPYCAGRFATLDNCLQSLNQKRAEEWHPTKNGSLTPKDVTLNFGKKVWWKCKKGHEWQATLAWRNKVDKCPICSSLEVVNPTLAKEWHLSKNGKLTPKDVTPGSDKKVWWICKKGHEWQAKVNNRARGAGCLYCANKSIGEDNSLQAINPRLAGEWHPTKNGALTPKNVAPNSGKKVWWLCKKRHEWQARIQHRNTVTARCPFCYPQTSLIELRIYTEIKYLFGNVFHQKKLYGVECDIYIPDLKFGIEIDGSYWHRKKFENDKEKVELLKNKGIILLRLREKGLKKISEHDIIYSVKDADFALFKKIITVILSKRIIDNKNIRENIERYLDDGVLKNDDEFVSLLDKLPGPLPGNSLFDLNRNLAQEWHPIKNGALSSQDVAPKSNVKVWWRCKKGHEWQTRVCSRSLGTGCPFCSNRKLNQTNCLESINPSLAEEWHPTKNQSLTPRDVAPKAGKRVWWLCKKGHEWQAVIASRSNGSGCPYCRVRFTTSDKCLRILNPTLAQEWHPTKNDPLTLKNITPNSKKKVWWLCNKGHEWKAIVSNRNKGRGCPICRSLEVINPTLAKEWHPTKNENLTPLDVSFGSNKKVWWLCKNGHEWRAIVNNRNKGRGCPFCNKKMHL